MRPLQAIAMGLVVVLISPLEPGVWDPLPDPLGWLLVLYGVRILPAVDTRRSALRWLAGLALLAACPLWVPDLAVRWSHADPALAWAVSLLQTGFLVVLGWTLADLAHDAGDRRAFGTWRTWATLAGAVAVLPVLVFGGGLDALKQPAATIAALTLLAVIVTGFAHSGRPWAGQPAQPGQPGTQDGPGPSRDRGRPQA